MFEIRKAQIEKLDAEMMRQFGERMLLHLRLIFHLETCSLSDAELREKICTSIVRAKSYGIIAEHDVRRYLESTALYGWELDTHPQTCWAKEILNNNNLDGEEKMDLIEQYGLET